MKILKEFLFPIVLVLLLSVLVFLVGFKIGSHVGMCEATEKVIVERLVRHKIRYGNFPDGYTNGELKRAEILYKKVVSLQRGPLNNQ